MKLYQKIIIYNFSSPSKSDNFNMLHLKISGGYFEQKNNFTYTLWGHQIFITERIIL